MQRLKTVLRVLLIRDTADRINGLERPKPNEGYALTNDISNNSISQPEGIVNRENLSSVDAQVAQYADIFGLKEHGKSELATVVSYVGEDADVGNVAQAFNAVYQAGKQGKDVSEAKNPYLSLLSEEQKMIAYNAGVMDGLLEKARSEKSSGEVLQNDGESGKIEKENKTKKEGYNGQEETKQNSSNGKSEGSNSRTSAENQGGSSVQEGLRSNGGISEELLLQRSGRGIDTDSHKLVFAETDIITRSEGTVAHEIKSFVTEYGIECYVISDTAWNRKSPAFSRNGVVYLKETIPDEHRSRIGPHEITHIMRHVGYLPYLNFIDRAPDLMNSYTKAARVLLNRAAEHCGIDMLFADEDQFNTIYDEFNATLYGHIAAGLINSETDWIRSAFHDFDGYVQELSDIHQQFKKDYKDYVSSMKTNSNGNAQHAKENAIEPERVVYSSEKAMAYDAVAENQLDAEQKKAVSIGKDIGRKVVIADTRNAKGVRVDGFLGKDGVIYISKYNKSPVAFIFKHELAHFCERAGQKYRDFMKAVQFSAIFKRWLKQKGYNSMLEYNSQIRKERAEIGIDPGEDGANNEIIANFVAEMMFGDDTTIADKLIGELKPKQRRSVRQFLRDFFDWIKGRFTGKGNTARSEILRLEKMFGKAFRTAVNITSETSGERFSLNENAKTEVHKALYDFSYRSDVRLRDVTPDIMLQQKGVRNLSMAMKASHIRENVFSEAEARRLGLPVNDKTHYHAIGEDFFLQIIDGLDDVTEAYRGTKNANNPSRRENYFLLLSTFKDKNGDTITVPVYIDEHADVNKVFIDVNKISTVFGKENLRNYLNTQVRNGNLVRIKRSIQPSERYAPLSYDYGEDTSNISAEQSISLDTSTTDISISDSDEKNNSQNAQNFDDGTEQFSYNPQNDKVEDVFERLRNGEISLNEAEKLLKKLEKDNPVNIANTQKGDMSTTPKLNKKATGKVGDGDSKFADSIQITIIFDQKKVKRVRG